MPDKDTARSAKSSKPAPSEVEGKDADPADVPEVAESAETKPAAKAPVQPSLPEVRAKKAAPKAAAKSTKSDKGADKTLEAKRRGKRYAAASELIEREKAYELTEAVKLVKQTSTTKFDGTVEIHLRMGVDPRQADQNIRGTVKLPAGTGKETKVMAFVPESQRAAAKKAGADFVSDEATLKKIKDGWTGFDVAVATPDQMPEVGKLGQALGPKGLMPNPKSGTVSDKPAEAIAEVKKGTIEFRVAKDATIHSGLGKSSFSEADLVANLQAYYRAIVAAKPSDLKGTYVRSLTLASSMGPGIKVDPESITTR